eukprot:PhF_6_TR29437/c2_g1_i14/m.43599
MTASVIVVVTVVETIPLIPPRATAAFSVKVRKEGVGTASVDLVTASPSVCVRFSVGDAANQPVETKGTDVVTTTILHGTTHTVRKNGVTCVMLIGGFGVVDCVRTCACVNGVVEMGLAM